MFEKPFIIFIKLERIPDAIVTLRQLFRTKEAECMT
jgi:hypothetical protein